ncbi:hypothetical protein NSK_007122 [Nannochloropsis salina CCMP1776]|uniref:Uncharacterized protein n=1 Tax=Nannochloropsis salina CCMP1776 TaxID=1027361 RepID=A0A4D9CWJ4_9STRA|nr:hypothetical protein NSK_007122 [Nannochloropsis salina CCMP1776]|eukprot:TFJ81875.1 hypothetical protein NSK_007122 [Nannochloropsis salina CCMP1776]
MRVVQSGATGLCISAVPAPSYRHVPPVIPFPSSTSHTTLSEQEKIHELANEKLPTLNADRGGTLHVTVRDVRNVLTPPTVAATPEEAEDDAASRPGEDGEALLNGHTSLHAHNYSHKNLRFLVEVSPSTAVMTEEGEAQVEVEEVGGIATFPLMSLEAKVVVHFGARLEHFVQVPLHNRYRESELGQLSDWHASAAVEGKETATETPGVEDLTNVPAVRLVFKFERRNRVEVQRVMEELQKLQEEVGRLGKGEGEGRAGVVKKGGVRMGRKGGIQSVDEDEEEEEEGREDGRGSRVLSLWRWAVGPMIFIIRVGGQVGGLVWRRRAIFMFIGGTLFFHLRGDDLAV